MNPAVLKKPFQLREAFELSGLLMMMFGPELKLIWINEGDILIKVTLRTPRHSSSDRQPEAEMSGPSTRGALTIGGAGLDSSSKN